MRRILSGISLVLLSNTVMLAGAAAEEKQDLRKKKPDEQHAPAQQRFGGAATPVFELGQIIVYGGTDKQSDIGGQSISQSVVSADDVHKSNRNTLDDALTTTPGVEVANTGGSRNERLIFVRGFDRFQVPLYVDGVRIYLPADNRIDYGRFLTPDLAEIQIQKGYVSVLSGPGGMGGAINLVTRKPTRELEGEIRTGVDVGNTGKVAAFTTSGSVGTRQENFYLQASGSYRNSDGWFLSRHYDPVTIGGGVVEDGGRRDFSNVRDWRANVKAGFTPNATDEYVISYTHQEGEKGAPYSVHEPVRGITSQPPGTTYQRNWNWPYWNIGSLAFNSNTAIGDQSYIKSKVYYNSFDNLLSAYDDAKFDKRVTTRSFDSYYKDHALGFSLEGGTDLIEKNTLKTALHFRRDVHNEQQLAAPGLSGSVMEPWQKTIQDTWSIAAEDTFHATDKLDFVGGISYDRMSIVKAEEFGGTPVPKLYTNPLADGDAFNWQMAAICRQSDASEFHASISSRTRFPTLFELYSTRFGDAIANPDLKAEGATNYEVGWAGRPTETLKLGGSLFYSDLKDVIQGVAVPLPGDPTKTTHQNQNVGDGRYYGVELYGEWEALANLTLGARYTYLHRQLTDPIRPELRPVGTPDHSAYLYAEWLPWEDLTVSPGVELYSSRWSTDRLENNFFQTKGFALVNLTMNYRLRENMSFDFGVRNILDTDYQLADGFPEAGRTFFLSSAVTF